MQPHKYWQSLNLAVWPLLSLPPLPPSSPPLPSSSPPLPSSPPSLLPSSPLSGVDEQHQESCEPSSYPAGCVGVHQEPLVLGEQGQKHSCFYCEYTPPHHSHCHHSHCHHHTVTTHCHHSLTTYTVTTHTVTTHTVTTYTVTTHCHHLHCHHSHTHPPPSRSSSLCVCLVSCGCSLLWERLCF